MKYGLMAAAGAVAFVASAQAADTPVYLHPTMKDIVAVKAQVLWDTSNNALDDDGNVAASKLKPADWAKLGTAAQAIKVAALALATAPKVSVGVPGTKVQDEGGAGGGATAAQIQTYIEKDPADFAAHARTLAAVADSVLTASKTRNAKMLGEASGKLDEVCEACHVKYWYPDQPK